MTHFSIQDVVGDAAYEPDPDLLLAERMRALPPYEQREIIRRAVFWGTAKGIEEVMKAAESSPRGYALEGYGVGMLGDPITDAVSAAVTNALKPLIPTLQNELLEIVKPAAQQAADVVGPVVANELKKKLPMFAIIAGVVAAVLGVLGMMAVGAYVVTKVG